MRMRAVPVERMTRFLEGRGARVLEVETHTDPAFGFQSSTYFATRD
jgi:hypothetical protein